MHVSSQLGNGLVQADILPVHYVYSVRWRIADLIPHETAKARQVCGQAGNAHDGAFGRGVAPWLVVAGKHAKMAATNKVLIVEAEKRVSRVQKLRMENNLQAEDVFIC